MARFILNKPKAIKQYNRIKEICDEVVYSFKTNPEAGKVLEEKTDCKFAIHTFESLEKLKDKKRVWFFAQAWNKEEVAFFVNQSRIKNEVKRTYNPHRKAFCFWYVQLINK